MNERTIRIAARLYEAREGLKLILGDVAYRTHMKEVGILLEQAAETNGLGIMDVATRLAKKAKDLGEIDIATMYLVAAVELLEPSV